MKITTKIISLALLLIMIFSLLTSCQTIKYGLLSLYKDEKRIPKIIDYINDAVDGANSYTLTSTGEISTSIMGVGLVIKTEISETMENRLGDAPTKKGVVKHNYEYSDSSLNFTIERYEGYQDGMLYYGVINKGKETKIKSETSVENFKQYDLEMSTLSLVCGFPTENASSEKADDGSWVITINDLSPDYFKSMTNDISGAVPGYSIDSIDATIKVNSDFTEWESELNYNFSALEGYVFSEGFYVPVATYTTKISNIDSTTVEKIDLEEYKEAADITIINGIVTDIARMLDKEYGKFTVSAKYVVNYRGSTYNASETDTVEYGVVDDKFYYNIAAKVGTETYHIEYADGVRTTDGIELKTSDTAEKTYLMSLVTGHAYNVLLVKDVRVDATKPDTYFIDLHLTDELLETLVIDGRKMTQGTMTMTVSYVNDEISVIKVYLKASASGVAGGATYEISITTMVIEFGEQT